MKYVTNLALLLAACACRSSDQAPAQPNEAYQVLLAGYQSGEHEAGATLIASAEEWEAYWRRHAGWRIPPAPMPAIDFGVHSVIAICAGDRPTGGWALEARSLEEVEGGLRVQAELRAPPAGALLPQVVTQPYQILLVPRESAKRGKIVLQLAQRESSR